MDRQIFNLVSPQRDVFNVSNMFLNHKKMMKSFDKVFSAIHNRMEEQMKLPTISIKRVIVEETPVPKPVEVIIPERVNGDIAKCITLLEQIVAETTMVIQEINNGEWAKTIPQVLDLVQKTIQAVECFKNNTANELSTTFNNLLGDKRECIVSHLQEISQHLGNAVRALMSYDVNAAVEEIKKVVDVAKDIANC